MKILITKRYSVHSDVAECECFPSQLDFSGEQGQGFSCATATQPDN